MNTEELVTQEHPYTEDDLNALIKSKNFDTNKISDGYHTFGELYEHRYVLFITLCRSTALLDFMQVFKTRKDHQKNHIEGWFILGINTPNGQISYHLPDKYWDDCKRFDEIEYNEHFDGHTSQDVLERLKQL